MLLRLHGLPVPAVRFRADEAGTARAREVDDGNEISPTVHVIVRWLTDPHRRQVAVAAAT